VDNTPHTSTNRLNTISDAVWKPYFPSLLLATDPIQTLWGQIGLVLITFFNQIKYTKTNNQSKFLTENIFQVCTKWFCTWFERVCCLVRISMMIGTNWYD